MNTAGTFSLSYCGSNVIHQFFCDVPQLLAISCSGNLMNELIPMLIDMVLVTCCFIFIVISYVHIFSAVRKIPSTEARLTEPEGNQRGWRSHRGWWYDGSRGDQSHSHDRIHPPGVPHPGDHGLLAPAALLPGLLVHPAGERAHRPHHHPGLAPPHLHVLLPEQSVLHGPLPHLSHGPHVHCQLSEAQQLHLLPGMCHPGLHDGYFSRSCCNHS
ncbi:uncharacterized protein LOC129146393 isoform X2 [Talpa occidentalis]|uniref:uncharacterized protein LOC129146393 isoform X2 n=1 Tax=Talpa occidentalis TaxID=50954 RepID=UPI0023F88505|nr:uncharacterized protein LOC129146393 isoform X2 [Talpa occidentalis]